MNRRHNRYPDRINGTACFGPYDIIGSVIFGATEGDSSIPYGTHELGPIIDDMIVYDDEGNDITAELSKSEIRRCEDSLVETILDEL